MKIVADGKEWRVHVEHSPINYGGNWNQGRSTVVTLHLGECFITKAGDGKNICTVPFQGIGAARCMPSDSFCRRTGRKLALARAIKNWPKAERSAIWAAYFVAMPQDRRKSHAS